MDDLIAKILFFLLNTRLIPHHCVIPVSNVLAKILRDTKVIQRAGSVKDFLNILVILLIRDNGKPVDTPPRWRIHLVLHGWMSHRYLLPPSVQSIQRPRWGPEESVSCNAPRICLFGNTYRYRTSWYQSSSCWATFSCLLKKRRESGRGLAFILKVPLECDFCQSPRCREAPDAASGGVFSILFESRLCTKCIRWAPMIELLWTPESRTRSRSCMLNTSTALWQPWRIATRGDPPLRQFIRTKHSVLGFRFLFQILDFKVLNSKIQLLTCVLLNPHEANRDSGKRKL